MKLRVATLLVILTASAWAQQNFTTVTATAGFFSGGPTPLVSGTSYFQAVTNKGKPISYRVGGGGHEVNVPTVCPIVNGVFSPACVVADTQLTNPSGIYFSLTVRDQDNKLVLGGPGSGYDCLQPSGSAWSLDQFIPCIPAIPPSVKPPTEKHILSLGLTDPSTQDDSIYKPKLAGPSRLALIACTVVPPSPGALGQSVTINVDLRPESAPDTPGTNILSSPLVCPGSSTVFTVSTLSTDMLANVQFLGITGTPRAINLNLTTTY